RFNPHDPKFGRTFAFAHTHFDRLFRHGNVGKYANPNAAGPLHESRERAASGFDLTRSNAFRLERLEPVLAEGKGGAARGNAVNSALVRLAELGADRLQHDLTSIRLLKPPFHGGAVQCRPRPISCPAPSDRARGFRP